MMKLRMMAIRICRTTFEIATAQVTLGFHVANHGLDGGASSEVAFD